MDKQSNKDFSNELRKRIYQWVLKLIRLLDTLDRRDPLCRVARDQLMRSGTSVGANYFEAIAGCSKKDFTNYLNHSLKSSNESKFWLGLLRDADKGNSQIVRELLKELIEIAKIFGSSIRTLRSR